MGTMIDFARPDGAKTKGYLAIAGQGRPGIVVIQEWWGLNDQTCGVADRFAPVTTPLRPISTRDGSPLSRTRPII